MSKFVCQWLLENQKDESLYQEYKNILTGKFDDNEEVYDQFKKFI